ncbi:MAG TPA: PEP-CTERM sorting domain-containing protein [Candidatus Angelobacter sp.]|nr:PEP-CTERM sorting domain-containing protein [Candidatus Angelobacter sp.]
MFYIGGTPGSPTTGNLTASYAGSQFKAPSSGEFDVFIGTDVLTGVATLDLLSQTSFVVGGATHSLDTFGGSYLVTGATWGFVNTGYRVGELVVMDFAVLDGKLSSGELQPAVPEPGTIAMVGTGLLAIAGVLRRKL